MDKWLMWWNVKTALKMMLWRINIVKYSVKLYTIAYITLIFLNKKSLIYFYYYYSRACLSKNYNSLMYEEEI